MQQATATRRSTRWGIAALVIAIGSGILWGRVVYLGGNFDGFNQALGQSGIYGFPIVELGLGVFLTCAAILTAHRRPRTASALALGSGMFAVMIWIGMTS